MENMSVKNLKNGHCSDYENPYNIRRSRYEEEPVQELNLKNQEWNSGKINLNIKAKEPNGHRKNIWYKVTGKETGKGGKILFTPYTFEFDRFPNSVAIREGKNHKKVVKLLYKSGLTTGEKIGRHYGCYTGFSHRREIYAYYPLPTRPSRTLTGSGGCIATIMKVCI